MFDRKIDKRLLSKSFLLENKNVDCLIYLPKSKLSVIKKMFDISYYKYFDIIHAMYTKIGIETIKKIGSLSFVSYITTTASVCACCDIARKTLNVDIVHSYGIDARGVTIAYIDTGVSPHFDLLGLEKRFVDFYDLIGSSKMIYDDNGHGTAVVGAGSGNGTLSKGRLKGVAPRSNFVCVKALDKNGEADSVKIIEAMDYINENRKKFNIKVVCMSLGSEPMYLYDPIVKGAETLWKNGLVVVCAAGNSGPEHETIKSPGCSKNLITVGGIDDRGENFFVPKFSSRGPIFNTYKPDIVAPAVSVKSLAVDDLYKEISGTSIATPMIAGLCALFLQKYPKAEPFYIKRRLMFCCRKITHDRNIDGFGYPDAYKFIFG